MGVGVVLAAAAILTAAAAKKDRYTADEKTLEEVKALLDAHDKAFTAHDLDGVLANYVTGSRTVVMGTGPGELWVGKEEIAQAYKRFFQDFDPGKQDFKYAWVKGGTRGGVAWLTAMGEIEVVKGGEKKAAAMNVSAVFVKQKKTWRFINMHFSTVTTPDEQ
jgi:uncharacterized protein (TIGR02246 family)